MSLGRVAGHSKSHDVNRSDKSATGSDGDGETSSSKSSEESSVDESVDSESRSLPSFSNWRSLPAVTGRKCKVKVENNCLVPVATSAQLLSLSPTPAAAAGERSPKSGRIGETAVSPAASTSSSRIPFSSSSKSSDVTEKSLDPYVDPIYSYSFGRSTGYLEYKTIGRRLDEMADKYPDHVAVISSHQSISRTYSQLNDEVHRLAKSLHDMMGIKRGDVIGIWSANVYEYILMQFAILRIGAIACAISPLCKSPELSHILRKGKVKALAFPGPQSLQNFVIDYTGILTAAEKPFLTDIIQMDGADDEAESLFSDLKSHSMQKLLTSSSGKLDEEILQSVSPDDVASTFFTSGTTGKPKGAATSHTTMLNSQRSINVNKRQIREGQWLPDLRPPATLSCLRWHGSDQYLPGHCVHIRHPGIQVHGRRDGELHERTKVHRLVSRPLHDHRHHELLQGEQDDDPVTEVHPAGCSKCTGACCQSVVRRLSPLGGQ